MNQAHHSKMTRILITGHDGFTGNHLWQHLERLGHELLAFQLNGSNIDLRDADQVEKALLTLRPDKIIHLAAISSVDHTDVKQLYDVNLWGTRNLLEAATKLGPSLDRIIIASSANIYGNQAGKLTETSSIRPANDYAVSKAAAEMLACTYKNRLPIVIVRPFNYIGVHQSTRFVVAKIIDHLRAGKPRVILGNLDVARDFSDVRDICYFYEKLISHPETVGEIYNLCSGRAIYLVDILNTACGLAGYQIEVAQDIELMRDNEIKSLYGDPAKINALIGPYKRYGLSESLGWMLNGPSR